MRLRTSPDTKITCDLVIRCGNAVSMMEVAPQYAFGLLQRPLCEWSRHNKDDAIWQQVGGEATYDRLIGAILELRVEPTEAQWSGIYFDVTDKQYSAQFHMDDTRVAFDAYAATQTMYIAKRLARSLKILGVRLDKAIEKDGALAE